MQPKKDLEGGASLLRGQVWVVATVPVDAAAAAALALPGVAVDCSLVGILAIQRRKSIRALDRQK